MTHRATWGIALLLTGCLDMTRADEPQSWPIGTTLTQVQCTWLSQEAAARIFDDAVQWRAAFPQPAATFSREPDWNTERVIVLSIGTRPSSGYAIALSGQAFVKTGERLELGFQERRPAANSFQQQMLTQPCVLMLVRRGGWQSVVFREEDSGVKLEASVPVKPR